MDYSQMLVELEQACGDFQVPATRFAAEQHLQSFGKRPDAIAIGKYALANSSLPTAKFFALRGIKESVIASYAVLGVTSALALRDELFQMAVLNGRSLESFVLDSLCWVIAVITKRAWIESSEEQRAVFTNALCEDITRHNIPCIGLITATYLIDEISGGSKCSEFHLPWEFHYTCKTSFERAHLIPLFEAPLKVMHGQLRRSTESQNAPPSGSHIIAYERRSALHVVERILSWAFTSPDNNKVIDAAFGCPRGRFSARGTDCSSSRRSKTGDLDDGDDYEGSGQAIIDNDLQNRTPIFPREWQSLLLNSDVLTMFFSVYEATLTDQMHAYFSPGSSHIALQCMIQVSGLRGKGIFSVSESNSTDSLRAQYAQVIMQNQLRVLRHVCTMDLTSEGSEDMVVATTQMIRRFIEAQLAEQPESIVAGERLHPLALLTAGVPETFVYFGEVSKFICLLLRAASGILRSDAAHSIDDDFSDVDNYFVMQAFDELASAWSSIINEIQEWKYLIKASSSTRQTMFTSDSNSSSGGGGQTDGIDGQIDNRSVLASFTQFLTTTAYMIHSEYIQLRMLACEDSMKESDSRSDAQSIDHGLLAKDYTVYEDQLQFIALLSRLDIQNSMNRLYESLFSMCSALQNEFGRLGNEINIGAFTEASDGDNQKSIDILHEQIHWIVLMMGYILADSGISERVLIPTVISESSVASHDIEHDFIVQSIMTILKTIQFELMSPSSILAAYGSPLLVETLFWTLRRIVPVYFLLDVSDYRQLNPHIVSAFGKASDGGNGAALISGILDLVRRAFALWTSEEDVLQMCIDMLLAFAQRSSIAQEITQSPKFTPLMLYLTSNMHRFPESTHSSMIEALAVLCSHSSSGEHERGFAELKTLIQLNVAQIVQDRNFAARSQDARVVSRLLDGLDMLDGILAAANDRNMDMLFVLIFEMQPAFVQMLSTYGCDQEIPRKVIQVVESATRYLDISSLSDNHHMLNFSHNIRSVLQQYQRSHQGQNHTQHSSEIEALNVITTLTLAISYLVHNEMGFAPNEASRSTSREVSDAFGETEVYGLYCIHTTTSPSQINSPNAMRVYMQLLSELIQFRTPSLIRWLPVETWQAVLNMLLMGIDNDIYDVGRRAYEAIGKLGAYIKIVGLENTVPEVQQLLCQGVKQLMSKLFLTLLYSPFDAELVESAGTALVTLGLIDPDHLQSCFGELLTQGNSVSFADRLSATFARFNSELETCEAIGAFLRLSGPIPDTIDSTALRQPLFEFLINTRAVLRVK
ncbi:hypothetical protein LPJ66_002340 [Kickxella alabastrina]|uniref:Uncharacterized protein n=1 Tax=Kickxella alabastrina TaxID=61397 RepID=A0ACC1IQQ6_9FUNG|nr:hypothetical protein LPJ66_002340 [Kickxella alabastrina]